MIALIPARGGSKGLPGKNIRVLGDKPLIAHTIEAALKAECIDRVIVTTDDVGIAGVAKKFGAEVPFLRPDYLATDTSSAIDVYIHAVEYLRCFENDEIDTFMVLLPTAPLRNENHINAAYNEYIQQKAITLISVREAEIPPAWYLKTNETGRLYNAGFDSQDALQKNRQENSQYLIPNGAIYILDYKVLREKRTYYTDNTIPFIMSQNNSIDIDTLDDFLYAQYLLERNAHSE